MLPLIPLGLQAVADAAVIAGGLVGGAIIGDVISNLIYSQNKDTRKVIDSLEDRVKEHEKKIKDSPDSQSVPHWEGEIKAWKDRIERLKKRLPNCKK